MAEPHTQRPQASALRREARQRDASPARLRELAEYPETHPSLASNPATPVDLLRQLAASSERAVLRGVATNRATPNDVLVALTNKADDRLGPFVARRAELPDEVCVRLAASPHYRVQWSVACRKQLPRQAVEVLARSPESTIQRKLAGHASTPAEMLAAFAVDPDPTWALDVLRNPNTDSTTAARLAAHPDPTVRFAALGTEPPGGKPGSHLDQSEAALRQLLASPDHRERAFAVKKIDSLDQRESEFHASDVCWLVRQAVSRRSDTPSAVLRLLAEDSSVEVRVEVARHRDTPTDVLQQLADTVHTKVAGRIANNKNTSSSTLTGLAEHWKVLHKSIAVHPNVSTELLWTLGAARVSRALRIAIAQSRNVDHRICLRAATDDDVMVRRSLAANPEASADCLAMLEDDDDRSLRLKLAANPTTPAETLQRLGSDPNPKVRKAVAHNHAAAAADRVLAALL